MFTIVPKPTFNATVSLVPPGGAAVDVSFTFSHKGRRELDAWLSRAKTATSDAEFLSEVVLGWTGIVDAEGKPVLFSRESLEALLDAYPSVAGQIVAHYHRELVDARKKP